MDIDDLHYSEQEIIGPYDTWETYEKRPATSSEVMEALMTGGDKRTCKHRVRWTEFILGSKVSWVTCYACDKIIGVV